MGRRWFFLLLALGSVLNQAIGLRKIEHANGSVSIVSSFYPLGVRLGTGEEVDTVMNLARGFKSDHSVQSEDMYVLVQESGKILLFSSQEKILEGRNLNFELRKMGVDSIHICTYIDSNGRRREADLYGRDLNSHKYEPHIQFDYSDYNPSL